MRTINGFFALFTFLALAIVACGGEDFRAAQDDNDAGTTHDVVTDKPKKDVGPDAEEDVVEHEAEPDQEAGADHEIPDQQAEDTGSEDTAPDQEIPDQQAEDAVPDNVEPDVEPPPDAKPDAQPNVCQKNMTTPNDYFVVGESPIGNTVRISIFGYVDFPPDAGTDTTMSGWCWGDLGQVVVACSIPTGGIGPGTDIYIRPGISLGDGDPQTAQLCEMGICNKTYTFCHGPTVLGVANGSNTSQGTEILDSIIKFHMN